MLNTVAEVKQIMLLDVSFNMNSSYRFALHMKVNRKSLQQLKETELNSYKIVMYLSSA